MCDHLHAFPDMIGELRCKRSPGFEWQSFDKRRISVVSMFHINFEIEKNDKISR